MTVSVTIKTTKNFREAYSFGKIAARNSNRDLDSQVVHVAVQIARALAPALAQQNPEKT